MKKPNKDGITLNEAMQHYLKAIGVDQEMHEASVLAQWEEIMGAAVAKRTEKKYIRDRVLYIQLNSSVMRDELMQQRSKIVIKINSISGVDIIDDIFLA